MTPEEIKLQPCLYVRVMKSLKGQTRDVFFADSIMSNTVFKHAEDLIFLNFGQILTKIWQYFML